MNDLYLLVCLAQQTGSHLMANEQADTGDLFTQPLCLPCGVEIPNRFAKAAMTEGLATQAGLPTDALNRLYGLWSDGGAGLLLSGNIIIDADHLERPGNVVIDRQARPDMQRALEQWASAATRSGNQFWAQISHAGRQTPKLVNPQPSAPSAVKVALPGGNFGRPRALHEAEIESIVERFAVCAGAVKAAGFTGIQLHAAHGYLLSQFLSPRTNQRADRWGGSLANRARLLLAAVAAVRAEVGANFPLAVKLNSADFQKGGFSFADSLQVARWLQDASVDLIEISGGTYEQPKLLGLAGLKPEDPQMVAASTLAREAYFVDFALAMRASVSIPLMVTGGFRNSAAMREALASGGVDMIGIGRPMCVLTDAPAQLIAGLSSLPRYECEMSLLPRPLRWLERFALFRTVATFAVQYWYYRQLESLGRQGLPNPDLSVFSAARHILKQEQQFARKRNQRAD
jgi:2,4-dienoyl-CoA reductase-like NADH-dependent reductase (Old Yellow Enzyme family)